MQVSLLPWWESRQCVSFSPLFDLRNTNNARVLQSLSVSGYVYKFAKYNSLGAHGSQLIGL